LGALSPLLRTSFSFYYRRLCCFEGRSNIDEQHSSCRARQQVEQRGCDVLNCEFIRFFTSYKAPGIRTTLVCPGHVLTQLFQTVHCKYGPSDPKKIPRDALLLPSDTKRIQRFLLPPLQPVDVVKPIIAALDSQLSQTIMVPFPVQLGPYINLMPSFVHDLLEYVSTKLPGYYVPHHCRADYVDKSDDGFFQRRKRGGVCRSEGVS